MTSKQAILIRDDLKLPKGKLAAQAAHAAVEAVLKSDKKAVQAWKDEGMEKVVLKVADEKELRKYIVMARDSGLKTSIITDAGRTVVEPGTTTCGAIGPADEKDIDEICWKLKLL
jgi:peptidyl-tRNA hydrolase, PTH2 family